MDLALPGLAIGWVDACNGGLEKFAANSTSEVREFSRVVRGSCVHRVVSASPSRPARPACPMPVDVRTRGGSGAKCAIREGIIDRNHGRTNWCSGAGARWLLWFACSTVRPACPCALRGVRRGRTRHLVAGSRCGGEHGVRDVPSPSARRRSAVARFHTRITVTCSDKCTSI